MGLFQLSLGILLNRLLQDIQVPFWASICGLALLFGVACQLVLRLATSMEASDCRWFVWPVTGGAWGGVVHECLPHLDVQLFGMSVCAAGLGLSGFWLIEPATSERLGCGALCWMLWAGFAVGLFGLSLGVCMNAWLCFCGGAGYAYSCGLATISGGGLLTLLKAWNGGDLFAAYGGVFGLQMVCFLAAALMTRRLDVVGFRNTVKTRFADVMEIAVD